MTFEPWALAGVVVLFLSLLATPLGLPGNWIVVAVLAIATFPGPRRRIRSSVSPQRAGLSSSPLPAVSPPRPTPAGL